MDVTDIIGRFGPFQYRLLAIICLRAISAAFLNLTFQLISFDVNFACDQSESELTNNIWSTNESSSSNSICDGNCEIFAFNKSSSHESLVQEWSLVCDREKYISFGYLAMTLGNFLAYIPAGTIADKYGRKLISFWGQLLVILGTLGSSLSNSMEMYLVTRLLTGMAFGLAQNPLMCLFVESVGPEYRDYVVFSFAGAYGLGMMSVAGVAYIVPQWRILYHLTNFFIYTPLLIVIWFIPESIRWLLAVGRNSAAEVLIVKHAAENNIVIVDSKSVMELVKKKVEKDSDEKVPNGFDLLRHPLLRKNTIIIYLAFMMTVFTYHGFIMTIGHLGGNLHINVFLTGLVELPVVPFYFLIVKFFDRRRGLLICFFLSGSLFLLSLPIPKEMENLRIGAAMIGRLLNALAYAILYVYAAELFPTNLRAVAVSGAMATGRIGGMISPLSDILARQYGDTVPITIYGLLSIMTSVILLVLPETRNKILPDTVEDTEKLALCDDDINSAEELLSTPMKNL